MTGSGVVAAQARATDASLASTTSGSTRKQADNRAGGDTGKDTPNSPFGAFENSKNRGPINIQSDSLALDYKNSAVLFSGKVHAVQADGQLTSNTLSVKYGKDFHIMQEMIADGDVRVSQGLHWCTADHMVMNQVLHTATLTGSPVCHDANDQISGPKITVHTDTGRSEVEGGVKALIFPHDTKTRDNEGSSSRTN
jgi:lipopolysaccharide transport protein LptA